jgi:hypothetical chaperone protein
MDSFIGLDFGTTNSALARADANGTIELARFRHAGGETNTFRSVLYFEEPSRGARGAPAVAGPRAFDRRLETEGRGRLLQSLKSYLAARSFTATNVLGTVYTLEELIAIVLRQIRSEAERQFGSLPRRAVFGRPVRFVGLEGDDDEGFPLQRLRAAAALAGFEDVVFEYEPVAAAHFYEQRLDHDETVLVADFGGGTSDFCLMRVGPGARRHARGGSRILGTEGVGLAGDAFDSEIVDHVVAPRLGMGGTYRSYFDGKLIAIPPWLYARLRRWHHLSFLKSRDTMNFLREVRSQAIERKAIDALIHVIEDDLGYPLYRSVEATKLQLSAADEAIFAFHDEPVHIEERVYRTAFEAWIREQLDAITASVDRLLSATNSSASDVDRVFMTGGTSFVPAVRHIFESRFGAAKLSAGDELTSVALGLASSARDLAA